jgi:uncharacterized cofD-like protein
MTALSRSCPPWHGARVVALGGGTGLPILLRGLKEVLFPPEWRAVPRRGRDRLTAIVTMADDGGSSGRLRETYGVLPPGDIRNCLLALSDGDPTLSALFDYRFDGTGDVAGHSLGNLILTALSALDGHFPRAVERAGELLAIRGRVLPSTVQQLRLHAVFADGTSCEGESRIASAARPLESVHLVPADAQALPEACDAIASADLVVIGPGSLYTSLIPVVLVRGIADALAATSARIVLVMNLMTEPGETDGYDAAQHVAALRQHAPHVAIHDVLVNAAAPDLARIRPYLDRGALPIVVDRDALEALGCRVCARDVLSVGEKVRHDPLALAQAVLEVGSVRTQARIAPAVASSASLTLS